MNARQTAGRRVVQALVALPLLTAPLPTDVVASNHTIVAGCHLTSH